MAGIIQEKFQLDYPQQTNDDAKGGWITDAEARAKKNTPGREGTPCGDYDSRYMNNAMFTNSLPPGMDIEDQEFCDIRKMDIRTAGEGDISNDANATAYRHGFTPRKMLPTDDMYTREHSDAFYDDVGGFCERNNVLDRL